MPSLEQQCRSYAAAHPDRDGGTWDQWCGSLMYRMCDTYGGAPGGDVSSAWIVWERTPTAGTEASDAPVGAFHFWDIGGPANGHVGLDARGGGGLVFMATRRVSESLGTAIGFATVSEYTERSGARYVGWCLSYADGDVTDFSLRGGRAPGAPGTDFGFGLTPVCQGAWQRALTKLGLYDGPIDDAFGVNSVKGMQQHLKNEGYLPPDYVVDGEPGPNYGRALQAYARDRGGYRGPQNGDPGENTSLALIQIALAILAELRATDRKVRRPMASGLPALPDGTVFGVDVATSQPDFDFAALEAAGGRFAIIKQGGGNAEDSPYVAPEYLRQLDRARAAGLRIGHYWFNGARNGLTPTTSAQFFVANAEVRSGEFVALDIEDEPETGTVAYTPEEALEFVREVERLRPGTTTLIYLSAARVREQHWRSLADRGHPLWVAMYDENDGRIPDEPPEIDDWADWSIWQYSSVALVPGNAAPMDANLAKAGLFTD